MADVVVDRSIVPMSRHRACEDGREPDRGVPGLAAYMFCPTPQPRAAIIITGDA